MFCLKLYSILDQYFPWEALMVLGDFNVFTESWLCVQLIIRFVLLYSSFVSCQEKSQDITKLCSCWETARWVWSWVCSDSLKWCTFEVLLNWGRQRISRRVTVPGLLGTKINIGLFYVELKVMRREKMRYFRSLWGHCRSFQDKWLLTCLLNPENNCSKSPSKVNAIQTGDYLVSGMDEQRACWAEYF